MSYQSVMFNKRRFHSINPARSNHVNAGQVSSTVLASGHGNGDVCLWKLSSGRLRKTLHAHTSAVNHIIFHRNTLITASTDRPVTLIPSCVCFACMQCLILGD